MSCVWEEASDQSPISYIVVSRVGRVFEINNFGESECKSISGMSGKGKEGVGGTTGELDSSSSIRHQTQLSRLIDVVR